MKKLMATLLAAFALAALFGVQAAQADPEGAGNSDKGLCTAYFNGQKNGHDKNGQPGPFQSLEDRAEAAHPNNNDEDPDNDVEGPPAVWDYCNSLTPPGNAPVIGGNPDHGRYDCETGDADNTCTENDKPGKG